MSGKRFHLTTFPKSQKIENMISTAGSQVHLGREGEAEPTQRSLVTGQMKMEVRECALFLFAKELERECPPTK